MEHKEVSLKHQRIYSTASNVSYVEMLYPEGWKITITDHKDFYGGYTYPYCFVITLTSPENTAAIYYYSPHNYIDDHLKTFGEYEIDDYGNKHHSFMKSEVYIDQMVKNHLKDFSYEFIQQIDDPDISSRQKARREAVLEETEKDGEVLNWHYFNETCRVYGFRKAQTDRVRCYSLIVEGKDVTRWNSIPDSYGYFNDPFMLQAARSVFPNAQYNRDTGRYVYTSECETRWNARKILGLDCMERDFEYLYNSIFRHIVSHGIRIHDDIWNDYRKVRAENEKRYEAIRAKKQQVAQIQRQMREETRQRNRETYDYVRKTQQEIHDIQRSSYENTQRTQAKVREMWGDVNQGNTRFVDRYGDEHVIHTYSDYAYKKGDKYVTSDSPLDHSYDWEELKKKKY